MTSTRTAVLSLALGATTALGIATPLLVARAANDTTSAPMARGMHRAGKAGAPLQNLAERFSKVDFAKAGVTKPAFWDDATTWLKSDDAKKVGAWLVKQHATGAITPPTTPPAPGAMLGKIDFAAAGVTKPDFWDALVTWVQTDDAKKVMQSQVQGHANERFSKLSDELGSADFTAAGIQKPAFWGDLVTWLKGEDAGKLAAQLMKAHVGRGGPKS